MRPQRNTKATTNGEPRRDERAEGSRVNTRISNCETNPNNEPGPIANDEDVNQGVDAQRFARGEFSCAQGFKAFNEEDAEVRSKKDPWKAISEAEEWETQNILRKKLEEIDQKVGVMWKEAKNPSTNLFSIGESPFIERIMKEDIPSNFKMPGESYDGISEPHDYLESFPALMVFHRVTDTIK
ncbi:hypothetical protein BUALT_Bualt01G0154000 [Buddleja alternifolia]|uniref:Uncharacterized protein n=1 Tax=Buddleja alternifolia TaxID=168488 RepID=A0AAV6YDU7_9LAMI|nr:hypothetical protein BUALT_Bualt01G0154000 [Buddleja alternifolia]